MRASLPSRFVLCVLLAAALGACATRGPAPQIDQSSVRALIDEGDYRAAAAAYERMASANRRQRDALLLLAAEALREEGDWAAVDELAERIKRKRLDLEQAARLDLLMAESALVRGDAELALALTALPEAGLQPSLRPRLAEAKARALLAGGKPLEAARERVAMNALLAGTERVGNENDILEALSLLDVAAMNEALRELGSGDAMRPWLERALRLKGAIPARVIPRPTRQVGALVPSTDPDAERPWQREGYAVQPRVALIVPLSGPLAAAGTTIRDGFLAAYFGDAEQRPQVRVFDVGESTQSAVAAYRRAVEDGSERVIGPLAREQVAAVLGVEDLRVPVLALNHPDSGQIPPRGSQQFGLLPDEEAAIVADRAIGRGLMRATILASTEEWSERAALAFRAQFEQNGGVIVGEARLAAGVIDYAGAIAQAFGPGGADLAFLAVRPPQGRLIVPQLRARGFQQLPLYATSHIYAGLPSRALDRDLNDVEFCDSPWLFGLTAGLPSREPLARRLAGAASSPRLFAFGMDAYRLLPYLDWLSSNPDAYLAGATGQLSIDEFGRVRRLPTWLRFVDGVPQAADGLLAPDGATTP